jgi:hypothetical protein
MTQADAPAAPGRPLSIQMRDVLYGLLSRQQKNAIKSGIAELRRLSPEERMRPQFLIVGGQKCGTTSLFMYLIRHGSYLRPLLKDIYYFDRHYDRGLAWYLRHYPSKRSAQRLARAVGGNVITGEGATHYLLHPWAAQRAAENFPDLKIIALLRDPVRRAISHYHHNRGQGRETITTPLEAFQREAERIGADAERMARDPGFDSTAFHHFSYLMRGCYAEQLQRWYERFPRERILVLSSESFFRESDPVFRRICRFLEIEEKSLASYPVEGGRGRKPDEDAVRFATEYFRPHNEALWALLGERWKWTS